MPDTKTSAETAASALTGAELIRGVQGGLNVKITGNQVTALVLLQNLGAFAATTSAQLRGVISDESGTGALLFQNGALGTPVSGVATNLTGLPLTTGVTGVLPYANGGVGKVTLTQPATGSTLTIADSKTLTISNTLTITAVDGSSINFGAGGTLAYTSSNLSVFASGGNINPASETLGTQQTTQGTLTLANTAAGAFATTLQSSNSASAAWTLTLPTTAGSNGQVLTTNGSGVTSWGTSGSGLTIGITTITSGTSTRLLYDAAGVVGESTITTDGTNLTIPSGSLTFSGAISASGLFSTAGIRHKGVAATFTDTQASTTVAAAYINVFGGGTFNASNTITVTNAYNAYFVSPIQGTATLTNSWALGADNALIAGLLKINAASGNLAQFQTGGADKFIIDTNGNIKGETIQLASGNALGTNVFDVGNVLSTGITLTNASFAFLQWTNSSTTGGTGDLRIGRLGAANLRVGSIANATPVANTITIGEASRSGTDSNVGGGNGTLQSGLGTGTGTLSSLIFQTPAAAASGTAAQTYTTRLTLNTSTATFTAAVVHGLPENLKAYTVATLPTGNPGDYAYVTDDTLSTWNSTLTGGSTGYTPVFKNATVWVSV